MKALSVALANTVPCPPDEQTRWLVDAMHLGSASLPIGGFAYSQGLEQARESGRINDRQQAASWIHDGLILALARQELPYWLACYQTTQCAQWDRLAQLATDLAALRETAEFRMEAEQMAYSLIQLAGDWLTEDASDTEHACLKLPDDLRELLCRSHTAAHAWLSARRGIPSQTGLTIYVWSWVEAQVAAAVKIVPLGQCDGQRLLHQARAWIDTAVRVANNTPLEDAATAAFGLTILSARHETQYSRLFRS